MLSLIGEIYQENSGKREEGKKEGKQGGRKEREEGRKGRREGREGGRKVRSYIWGRNDRRKAILRM